MNNSVFSDDAMSSPKNARPTTAVAIDKDRHSQQAVKWTLDHLLLNTNSIVLVHVRTPKDPINRAAPEVRKEQVEDETTQLFLPYRGICARKGLQLVEVVLEDVDVSKAIIDYISANIIQSIVVGASSRNAFRKFMYPDVPSCLIKNAPDFCGVYVIYKLKPLTIRTPRVSLPVNALPPRRSLASDTPSQPAEALDYPFRNNEGSLDYKRRESKYRLTSAAGPSAAYARCDALESSVRSSRTKHRRKFTGEIDTPRMTDYHTMDFGDAFELADAETPSMALSPASVREAEVQMRRLRLELKQTTEMCNAAFKEALEAKEKARELQKLKMEETRKIEEIRQSEEAALAILEIEKAKCKAALEAAEAAQRVAELEAKRRLNAEMKTRRAAKESKKQSGSILDTGLRYRKYSIDEIEVATNFFSESLKIGEGGYGPVFRALLQHTPVAIKVLRPEAAQGRIQFQQEVEVLSAIRHPNMVLLLGACPEFGCLVYEYMDYGSLDDRLFRRGKTPPIPWPTRFRIAAEIATALLFLHQTKPEPIVHRDLKPANILLNRNYVCKISDVGLARLVPPSVADTVTQYRMTSAAGTFCYIDPEYQQTGMLGVKSDVYSLGVMLLQIVTAKGPMGLAHQVERAIEKGNFAEMLDPAVEDWPLEEALALAMLALKCTELRRKDRPDLGTVVLPELNRLRSHGEAYEANQMKKGAGLIGEESSAIGSVSMRAPWPVQVQQEQEQMTALGPLSFSGINETGEVCNMTIKVNSAHLGM